MVFRFLGKVQDRKLRFLDSWADVAFEKLEGQAVIVTLRKWSPPRTNDQNRYYWGVVLATIAGELGYADPQELHEALAMKFLGWQGPGGLRMRRSTAELDTKEFAQYVDSVKLWAEAELGIVVPEPEGN